LHIVALSIINCPSGPFRSEFLISNPLFSLCAWPWVELRRRMSNFSLSDAIDWVIKQLNVEGLDVISCEQILQPSSTECHDRVNPLRNVLFMSSKCFHNLSYICPWSLLLRALYVPRNWFLIDHRERNYLAAGACGIKAPVMSRQSKAVRR